MDLIKNISPTELIIILFLLVIIFGAKSVSDLARKGGETFKEAKKIKKEILDAAKDEPVNP